ncbi:MAG: branched-chain amino acid transaminase [bacterium]|nr:branched-chain amino acid transaminase [bacterium]MDT8366280.1 branched-chain amino acid transaminase [bacterium]
MVAPVSKIWMNGEMVNWEDAQVHVLTHTLHYGLGVFEGIRFYKTPKGPGIFRLKDHVQRLSDSSHICRIKVPYDWDTLYQAHIDLVRVNGLADGYIRPVVYLKDGPMGLLVTDEHPVGVFIAAWAWGAYLGEDGLKNGIRVKISSFARNHVNAMMTKAKINGAYVNSILSKREAIQAGYQETIMLDTDGYVSEGSGENLFIVRKGVIKTTSLTSILSGITRESVFTLADELGYQVVEDRFTRDELYIADEAFFTGTAAEITPIREVDDRAIGEGRPGPVTKAIQDAYFKAVHGEDPNHMDWVTVV